MTLRTWLGLILCNLIWSVHPLMGKWILEEFSPVEGAWLRYLGALFGYFAIAFVIRFRASTSENKNAVFLIPHLARDKVLILLLGFLPFCFSPLLQMTGLSSSLASENAIIVAMEPLLTAFLAWAFLRESMALRDAFAFILALIGFAFLAGLTPQLLNLNAGNHLGGNVLILVSLLGEASYTVLARKLAGRYSPLGIFGTSLTVGVLFLSFLIFFRTGPVQFPEFHHFTWKTLLAFFWLGPLGTAGGYLYLMYALVNVPVMSITFFLFLQPLAGAFWGYLFLGDRMTLMQGVGSGLILSSIMLPYVLRLKKPSIR